VTAARVQAPAKLNPWLAVLGRRADGFHDVDLGMLALELSDVVEARATDQPGVQLELSGPALSADVPADERNLAWRAAEAVLELAPAGLAGPAGPGRRGVHLRLEKHVPSRAGLGGGSSDAAAACVATALALGFEPARADLLARLADLGSDCPFFLAAEDTGYARCRGRGDQVQALPAAADGWHIALLTPDVQVPTGPVFAQVSEPSRPVGGPVSFDLPAEGLRAALFNDLEGPAELEVPALAAWRSLLDAVRPGFRMSGSGSSFFCCFREREAADRCLDEAVTAAARCGLSLRGAWVTRPIGHGVRRIG